MVLFLVILFQGLAQLRHSPGMLMSLPVSVSVTVGCRPILMAIMIRLQWQTTELNFSSGTL